MSAVLAAKEESLRKCISRIRDVWKRPSVQPFAEDLDKQEIVVLNLIRAFEVLLDMASHLVRVKRLGWPKDNAEVFDLLEKAGLVTEEMKTGLKKGNAMRNILVHEYEEINLDDIANVIENHLDEMLESGQRLFSHGSDDVAGAG